METLLKKIDDYLTVQDEKDAIEISSNPNEDLKDIIEIVKNSKDIDKTLLLFSEEIREKIQKLIEGGIL